MRPWRTGAAAAVMLLIGFALRTGGAPAAGETRAPAQQRAAPAKAKTVPPNLISMPAPMICPAPLGTGARTRRLFCDVLAGRDPAGGIRIKLPPHAGAAILTFDLHNRHTYSEEQVRSGRAFAQYTATIGVLTLDNTLIARAVVQSEFRSAKDLLDRIEGGAGPGGVKAVAPVGIEPVVVEIPAGVQEASLLGEKLRVETLDGRDTFSAAGRPIAIISNVVVQYRPAPPPAVKRLRRR